MRADRVAYAGEKSVEIGPVGQLEVTNPPPTYYFENDPLLSRQLTRRHICLRGYSSRD